MEGERGEVRICSLASGSDGNCLLVQAGEGALLIDAGISARAVLAGLAALGVPEGAVRAILITHEHSDHVRGLHAVARRLGATIVANRDTLARILDSAGGLPTRVLRTGDAAEVAGIGVRSIALSHDASDPVGYLLACGGRRVGYVTDTGVPPPRLLEALSGVDLAILEANHDVPRLLAGPYPAALKERILGDSGHLSNEVAAGLACELAAAHAPTEIWLAHLSAVNNTPRLALATVRRALDAAGHYGTRLEVLPRGRMGPVWGPPRLRQLSLLG